jgi:hypothetical protein
MSRLILGMLLIALFATAAHPDCKLGSEPYSDGSVRKMDDGLLYRCREGRWLPWDPNRATIHVVAATWLPDHGYKPPIDLTEKAKRECEHKPSCTLVADSGWLSDPFPGHARACRSIGIA